MDFATIEHQLPQNSWNSQCIKSLLYLQSNGTWNASALNLVDANGQLMDGFSDETWGITIRECYNHCGLDKIPYVR